MSAWEWAQAVMYGLCGLVMLVLLVGMVIPNRKAAPCLTCGAPRTYWAEAYYGGECGRCFWGDRP